MTIFMHTIGLCTHTHMRYGIASFHAPEAWCALQTEDKRHDDDEFELSYTHETHALVHIISDLKLWSGLRSAYFVLLHSYCTLMLARKIDAMNVKLVFWIIFSDTGPAVRQYIVLKCSVVVWFHSFWFLLFFLFFFAQTFLKVLAHECNPKRWSEEREREKKIIYQSIRWTSKLRTHVVLQMFVFLGYVNDFLKRREEKKQKYMLRSCEQSSNRMSEKEMDPLRLQHNDRLQCMT